MYYVRETLTYRMEGNCTNYSNGCIHPWCIAADAVLLPLYQRDSFFPSEKSADLCLQRALKKKVGISLRSYVYIQHKILVSISIIYKNINYLFCLQKDWFASISIFTVS